MKFSDIFGHGREIEVLKRAVASGRMPHSYLFTGIEGIGKKLVARALAAALNCSAPQGVDAGAPVNNESCGECRDCRAFKSGVHENLVIIGPNEKGNLNIDQVRDVQRAQRFKVNSGTRVIIVDSAEAMQAPAQNAFLKTLEEPVKGTMIILVASRPSALLPTILSRCQRVSFSPLAEDLLKKALIEAEGLDLESAALLASYGVGSFSRAISALRDGTYESGKAYLDRLLALDPADSEGVLKLAYDLSKDDFLQGALEFIKTWLRDETLSAEGAGYLVAGDGGRSSGNARGASGANCVKNFDVLYPLFAAVDSVQRDIAAPRNANKQLAMEALVMDFTSALRTTGGF